jgi:hypothetical protein
VWHGMAHVSVEESAMAAMPFGLIGMGTHGMRYARHLMHDVEGTELSTVCRQDPLRGISCSGTAQCCLC